MIDGFKKFFWLNLLAKMATRLAKYHPMQKRLKIF